MPPSPAFPARSGALAPYRPLPPHAADSPLPLLTWPCFDGGSLRADVTTRAGGVSSGPYASANLALHVGDADGDVLENRSRAAAAFGVALDDCVFAEQAGGTAATRVFDAMRGRGARSLSGALPGTDALVTTDPGAVLVILVADCVPIVLYDAAARVLALVHAGWRGTVSGVIPTAVALMGAAGADPSRVVAAIGPTISAETYQVGADVGEAARSAFGADAPRVLVPDGTGRFLLDLVGAARMQLAQCGLDTARVHTASMTTGADTPFFSHRADEPCGRFAVMARLVTDTEASRA
jgi:YfiH family protein